ncbi:MAG: radical SAM protein, partial [Candidatus Lokiarchaeota archaeon]|nr:radical SAM protein [Candidatus Lokiarchaeota archaeon]
LHTGEIIGTGILNPLIKHLNLLTMFLIQAKFYRAYKNLGKWRGKRVANTFAPPIGSGAMFRAIWASLKSRIFHTHYPVAMTFAVNYDCQCDCIHCSAGRHKRSDIKELSTEEAKKLIDDSLDLGISILAFTGGEPLLRNDIYELISHVDKRKAVPLLFTNGEFLTLKNIMKLKKAGLYSLFVSLDSFESSEHDQLRRRRGLFNKAVQGIKLARKEGLFVGISTYATRSGTMKNTFKKIYSLARELGVHNVMLFDGVATGNMLHDTSELLTQEQREKIRTFSSYIFNHSIIPPLSSQSWQNSIEGYLGGIGCLAANIQYYVSAYGEVTPCDFTPLSFGNIREESLKKIWKRMVKHPAYNYRSTCCRMQHATFRKLFIDPIPDGAKLPYNISNFF